TIVGPARRGRAMVDEVRRIGEAELREGHPTPGMVRREAVSTEGMWSGLVHTDAGMMSGWHHHGEFETTIYVVSGAMRLEFGPGGASAIDVGPGEFVYVPKHAVHREANPTGEQGTAVIVRAGS